MPHPSIGMGSQFKKALIGLTLVIASLQSSASRAGPLQTWLQLPEWLDLSIDYTAEPMAGISGGANPSASSWYQAVVLDLSLSSGFGKNQQQ